MCLAVLFAFALPVQAADDPHQGLQWGIEKIGAPSAWNAANGDGVVIAVVDTGVHLNHEDLNVPGKLVPGFDFEDNDSDPQDQHGHGTHVAGIAAAATGNGKGVAGTAGGARIMPVRVLNAVGVGVNLLRQKTADGIRWAADHGAKVINLSLGNVGGGGPGSAMSSAISYAWSKGVVSVVAAENDSGASSGYTNHPALVVVATDRNDNRAGYSNIAGSAKWAISAPGTEVYSTWYDFPTGNNGSYETQSGTSMAAPHVSGAVALMLSLGLTPQQAIDRLLATAVDLGAAGKDSVFGYGRLNLAAAAHGLAPPNTNPNGGGRSGNSNGGSSGGGGSGGKVTSSGDSGIASPSNSRVSTSDNSGGGSDTGAGGATVADGGSRSEGVSDASGESEPIGGIAGQQDGLGPFGWVIGALLAAGGVAFWMIRRRRTPTPD